MSLDESNTLKCNTEKDRVRLNYHTAGLFTFFNNIIELQSCSLQVYLQEFGPVAQSAYLVSFLGWNQSSKFTLCCTHFE